MAGQPMFERILLFLDASDASLAAAAKAIDLAKKEEAELVAVSVLDTDTLNMLLKTKIFLSDERDEYEQELEAHAKKYQRYAQKMAEAAGLDVEFEMLRGVPHRVIAEAAHRHRADLVVMGTAREQVGKRSLLTRERQLILGEVGCAVLMVPPEAGEEKADEPKGS